MFKTYEKMLSAEQIEFVKKHAAPDLSARELAEIFNRQFGTTFKKNAMQEIRRRFVPGFKPDWKKMMRKTHKDIWTEARYEKDFTVQQRKFIRRFTRSDISAAVLAQKFNQQFGTSLSAGQMNKIRGRLTPGFVRVIKNPGKGYARVKNEDGQFVQKHAYIWEKHYGPLPPGFAIVFIDGDKTNFNINNLIALQRGIQTFMNQKKIPLSILADKDGFKAVLTMQQVCRIRHKIKKPSEAVSAASYQPVGRPGFAF